MPNLSLRQCCVEGMTSERNGFNSLLVSSHSSQFAHFQCHGGDAVVRPGCTSGLVFNERKRACDYRVNVPECGGEESNNDLPGLYIPQLIEKYARMSIERKREHLECFMKPYSFQISFKILLYVGLCSNLDVSCLVARHSAGG